MMKRILAALLAVLVFGLSLTGCAGTETGPEESGSPSESAGSSPEKEDAPSESESAASENGDPSSENEPGPVVFREWDTDLPFELAGGVTVKCTLGTDEEAIRKEVAFYLDPDKAEASFAGKSMRWIRADVTIAFAEDAGPEISKAVVMLQAGDYPDVVRGTLFEAFGQGASYSFDNETFCEVITMRSNEKQRLCRATTYALIPSDNDSFAVVLSEASAGAANGPDLSSALLWKVSDAEEA